MSPVIQNATPHSDAKLADWVRQVNEVPVSDWKISPVGYNGGIACFDIWTGDGNVPYFHVELNVHSRDVDTVRLYCDLEKRDAQGELLGDAYEGPEIDSLYQEIRGKFEGSEFGLQVRQVAKLYALDAAASQTESAESRAVAQYYVPLAQEVQVDLPELIATEFGYRLYDPRVTYPDPNRTLVDSVENVFNPQPGEYSWSTEEAKWAQAFFRGEHDILVHSAPFLAEKLIADLETVTPRLSEIKLSEYQTAEINGSAELGHYGVIYTVAKAIATSVARKLLEKDPNRSAVEPILVEKLISLLRE